MKIKPWMLDALMWIAGLVIVLLVGILYVAVLATS